MLVCAFAVAMVACGGSNSSESATDTTATAPDTTKVEAPAADTTKTDTTAQP